MLTDLIPRPACPKLLQLGEILPKYLPEPFLDIGVGFHFQQASLQLFDLLIQKSPEFSQNIVPPGRFGRIAVLAHIQNRQSDSEPAVHIRPAPHFPVGHFDCIRKKPVIAAIAKGLCHFPKFRVSLGVAFFQQPLQYLILQNAAFGFLRNPEIGRNIQLMGIGAQQIGAKRMYGGDLRQIQPVHLPLQMPVSRFPGQALAQSLGNLDPQLCRRCFCIGYHQERINVAGMHRITDPGQQAVDQYLRLSGSGGSGHQQGSARVFHNGTL